MFVADNPFTRNKPGYHNAKSKVKAAEQADDVKARGATDGQRKKSLAADPTSLLQRPVSEVIATLAYSPRVSPRKIVPRIEEEEESSDTFTDSEAYTDGSGSDEEGFGVDNDVNKDIDKKDDSEKSSYSVALDRMKEKDRLAKAKDAGKTNRRHSIADISSMVMHYEKTIKEQDERAFNPNSTFMKSWDTALLVLLCVLGVLTPFEVAMLETSLNALFFLNRIFDLMFFLDIYFNFNLAYKADTGAWEYDKKRIRCRYLKSSFVIDFISTIPFDVFGLYINSDAVDGLRILRIVKLLRLMKLLRLLRASRIFTRWEAQFGFSYASMSLAKFTCGCGALAHWGACLWVLGPQFEDEDEDSWIKAGGFDRYDTYNVYLAALYWSTMTITTIGYGDIGPKNPSERVIAIIAMVFGAIIYAYAVGSICGLVATMDESTTSFHRCMDSLNSYMAEENVPNDMRVELRDYFNHCKDAHTERSRFMVLSMMSPGLRGIFTSYLHRDWLERIPFFKNVPEVEVVSFTVAIALNLKHQSFPPREGIIKYGETAAKMYIIKKGLTARKGCLMSSGKSFGEDFVLSGCQRFYSVQALTYCNVLTIDQDDLKQVLIEGNFRGAAKGIRRFAIRLALRREFVAFAQLVQEERAFTTQQEAQRKAKEAAARGEAAPRRSRAHSGVLEFVSTRERAETDRKIKIFENEGSFAHVRGGILYELRRQRMMEDEKKARKKVLRSLRRQGVAMGKKRRTKRIVDKGDKDRNNNISHGNSGSGDGSGGGNELNGNGTGRSFRGINITIDSPPPFDANTDPATDKNDAQKGRTPLKPEISIKAEEEKEKERGREKEKGGHASASMMMDIHRQLGVLMKQQHALSTQMQQMMSIQQQQQYTLNQVYIAASSPLPRPVPTSVSAQIPQPVSYGSYNHHQQQQQQQQQQQEQEQHQQQHSLQSTAQNPIVMASPSPASPSVVYHPQLSPSQSPVPLRSSSSPSSSSSSSSKKEKKKARKTKKKEKKEAKARKKARRKAKVEAAVAAVQATAAQTSKSGFYQRVDTVPSRLSDNSLNINGPVNARRAGSGRPSSAITGVSRPLLSTPRSVQSIELTQRVSDTGHDHSLNLIYHNNHLMNNIKHTNSINHINRTYSHPMSTNEINTLRSVPSRSASARLPSPVSGSLPVSSAMNNGLNRSLSHTNNDRGYAASPSTGVQSPFQPSDR